MPITAVRGSRVDEDPLEAAGRSANDVADVADEAVVAASEDELFRTPDVSKLRLAGTGKRRWSPARAVKDPADKYRYLRQGCQMVSFQTKNPNLGKFLRVLQWTMMVYFMDIFSRFGILY
jgi:hypothetical protein